MIEYDLRCKNQFAGFRIAKVFDIRCIGLLFGRVVLIRLGFVCVTQFNTSILTQ
jgi:hypothetical protein